MSHNKSRMMQAAKRQLGIIVSLDAADPHALPGSVLSHVKAAIKILDADIRKRRDGRERESFKRGSEDGH